MCQEKHKHWKEIDFLYSLGIVLVLIGHSHSSDWTRISGTQFERIILFIYTFHMPLFFFISGFLFENSESIKKYGFWNWIRNKAIRLLTPYFFWSLIAALPKQYLEEGFLNGFSIVATFIYPRLSVWGHFWFLPVLFLVYLLFGVAKSLHKEWICFLISLILYFVPIKTNLLGISDLSNSLIYFSVGMAFNNNIRFHKSINVNKCWKIIYSIIMTSICFLLTDFASMNTVIGLCVALLMISVCWVISEEIEVGNWISTNNFTIYIFSWLFQSVMMIVCGNLHWIPTFILMFIAGVAGPSLIITVYEKLSILHMPIVRILFGFRT